MSDPRYSIGIDLGTTHCALSYVDFSASDGEKTTQEILPVTQLTAPATIDNLPLLPSFLYLPHPSELAPFDLGLPWTGERDFAVAKWRAAVVQARRFVSYRVRRAGSAIPASTVAPRFCPTMRHPKWHASRRSKPRSATSRIFAKRGTMPIPTRLSASSKLPSRFRRRSIRPRVN
jgi:molecular chaperone DnaK (HSP70)